MALRSRLAISIAVGALTVAAFATPAAADDEWGSGSDSGASQGDDWGGSQGDGGGGEGDGGAGGDGGGSQDWGGAGGDGGGAGGDGDEGGRRFAKGVVTANTLLLRSAPNRRSQVIRVVHKGDIVRIFCKTPGQRVQGNPLWYLLADGTWAWGAARYIDNIGPAPRWC
ncbi:SH3 domain-containing protein [Streptomyces sp. DT2A-34]|uniref:SH3 domain-containing protein n=1 Tax=Streptomyces sp. DT2A-34 TaxID=3051182 RepID=UPI00265BE5BC|nr:SH3 domain-containing protein [Streptomyces sp. DT2A-34]MDO0911799.1 SH3 domain-containing protein [Streptomyces sp. DT2A-34]